VRCPLHHACFSLRSGEVLRAPALDPIPCWRVERQGETVSVREKLVASRPARPARPASRPASPTPRSIMIVGGGAAGLAAADMVRREGYEGPVTIVSADDDPPVDRPNLSKDFLAGEAQDDWIPLWPPETYAERHVDLVLRRRVSSIDPVSRSVLLDDGSRREFGALLIATGADPVRLPIPGADSRQVFYLRSFADSRAIVERARAAKHVVVVGASFIGLEVSASLRARGIAVDVVAPERVPLERVMGVEVGRFVQSLHEAQGVVFHLGQTVSSVAGRTVTLSGGGTLDADFVVVGVGVRPATAVAEKSGLALDRGIAVNEYLETLRACLPPAMSPGGRTRTRESVFEWSTGSWPSARVKSRRGTCWAAVNGSTPCRSFGANTTTSRSNTSDMRSAGTRSAWTVRSRPETARSPILAMAGGSPLSQSIGTARASRPKCSWSGLEHRSN